MAPLKLNETLELRKSDLETKIESVRQRIDEALETLGTYEGAQGERRTELREFENSKLARKNPKGVDARKKRLDHAGQRVESKTRLIMDLEAREKKLEAEFELVELRLGQINDQIESTDALGDFEFSKDAYKKPNSVFKVFEGRFTPPEYRVMPKADRPYASEPWSRISLDRCIVDPKLIPDWLIKEFNLVEWSDDLNEVAKLKLKIKAIPKLLELFSKTRPLMHFDGNGHMSPNYRFLAVSGFDPRFDGKMIYSRSYGHEEESVDGKMVQTYDSAYDALRMVGHAKDGYQSELALLTATEMEIESLQAQLSELRKNNENYQERKEELRGAMSNVAERFKKSTNYHKQSAYQAMHSKIDFTDTKSRENLGATCAVWLKAIRLLKKRAPQATNKSAYGQTDRLTLEKLVSDSESLLHLHFSKWFEIADRLRKMGACTVFNGTPENKLGDQRENLFKSLFAKSDSLRPLDAIQPVRPFLQYAHMLNTQREKVLDAIWKRNQALAVAEATKAIALGGVFKAQQGIEEIIRSISMDPTPNPDSLESQADRVASTISADPSFAAGSTAVTLKDLILSTLAEFKKNLAEVRKANPPVEQLGEALMPLKKKLHDLDFTFYLGSLE